MVIVQNIWFSLILFAAIASGVTAGIFFAFSTFVMQALGQQPSASGIATMQSINITVINPWFMAAFFGPAIVGVVLAISRVSPGPLPGASYCLAAILLYVIGTVGVTFVGNVPLNEALAIVSPGSAEGATLWTKYLTDWTVWNHVRTIAAVVAAGLFTLGLMAQVK
ncbi:MAG: DUF1772 domain-containing protein [Spirulinaceae cyanobacterium]